MPTFTQRIQLVLPPWWGSSHPNLDSIIAGYAAGHLQINMQIQQLRPLMRLNTVTGDLLDIASYDFLGNSIIRNTGETDTAFRARVKAALFPLFGFRSVFQAQVNALAGATAVIIDPRRPLDTGYAGNVTNSIVPTLFYNSTRQDCLTNYKMPYQWFLRVKNNSGLSDAALRVAIQQLMPAGTVCYTMIKAT